ncbi:MAG TPA: hypothetical protein VGR47_17505 [Terracidiphilus sp.]|nr:hypothetical protein [Terracidiphilus sp.]
MASVILHPSSRRFAAAIWFASFGLLATVIFFHQLSMAAHAVILYIVLPSVSLGIAGFIWGGAILDSSKVKNHRESLVKGLGVTIGAYVIFALLYANGLPLLEIGWSQREVVGLLFFTLTFGLLLGGPMAAVAGIIAAASLFSFRRYLSDGRESENSQTGNR